MVVQEFGWNSSIKSFLLGEGRSLIDADTGMLDSASGRKRSLQESSSLGLKVLNSTSSHSTHDIDVNYLHRIYGVSADMVRQAKRALCAISPESVNANNAALPTSALKRRKLGNIGDGAESASPSSVRLIVHNEEGEKGRSDAALAETSLSIDRIVRVCDFLEVLPDHLDMTRLISIAYVLCEEGTHLNELFNFMVSNICKSLEAISEETAIHDQSVLRSLNLFSKLLKLINTALSMAFALGQPPLSSVLHTNVFGGMLRAMADVCSKPECSSKLSTSISIIVHGIADCLRASISLDEKFLADFLISTSLTLRKQANEINRRLDKDAGSFVYPQEACESSHNAKSSASKECISKESFMSSTRTDWSSKSSSSAESVSVSSEESTLFLPAGLNHFLGSVYLGFVRPKLREVLEDMFVDPTNDATNESLNDVLEIQLKGVQRQHEMVTSSAEGLFSVNREIIIQSCLHFLKAFHRNGSSFSVIAEDSERWSVHRSCLLACAQMSHGIIRLLGSWPIEHKEDAEFYATFTEMVWEFVVSQIEERVQPSTSYARSPKSDTESSKNGASSSGAMFADSAPPLIMGGSSVDDRRIIDELISEEVETSKVMMEALAVELAQNESTEVSHLGSRFLRLVMISLNHAGGGNHWCRLQLRSSRHSEFQNDSELIGCDFVNAMMRTTLVLLVREEEMNEELLEDISVEQRRSWLVQLTRSALAAMQAYNDRKDKFDRNMVNTNSDDSSEKLQRAFEAVAMMACHMKASLILATLLFLIRQTYPSTHDDDAKMALDCLFSDELFSVMRLIGDRKDGDSSSSSSFWSVEIRLRLVRICVQCLRFTCAIQRRASDIKETSEGLIFQFLAQPIFDTSISLLETWALSSTTKADRRQEEPPDEMAGLLERETSEEKSEVSESRLLEHEQCTIENVTGQGEDDGNSSSSEKTPEGTSKSSSEKTSEGTSKKTPEGTSRQTADGISKNTPEKTQVKEVTMKRRALGLLRTIERSSEEKNQDIVAQPPLSPPRLCVLTADLLEATNRAADLFSGNNSTKSLKRPSSKSSRTEKNPSRSIMIDLSPSKSSS